MQSTTQNKKIKFNYKWILNNIYFIIFLAFLGIINISNVHLGEKKIRGINKLGNQNQELAYQYKTLNGNLMFQSKKSELEKVVAKIGLQLPKELPILITDSTIINK
jgi:Tfp pilus assembly protein PilO